MKSLFQEKKSQSLRVLGIDEMNRISGGHDDCTISFVCDPPSEFPNGCDRKLDCKETTPGAPGGN